MEFRDESREMNIISGTYLRNGSSAVLYGYSQSLGYISCGFIVTFSETWALSLYCHGCL